MQLPDPHPDPPADLHRHQLPITDASGPWIRSHARARAPLFFGATGLNRFDAPTQQYGVLYVAADIHGAFIETFGRQLGRRRLSVARIASRELTQISQSRRLRLVDLTGPGLSWIGADARLGDGLYTISQRWALALHEHPEQPDGILYRSRHDPDRICAAIFDRAAGVLTATLLGSLAEPHHASLLADLLDTYRYSLIGP